MIEVLIYGIQIKLLAASELLFYIHSVEHALVVLA